MNRAIDLLRSELAAIVASKESIIMKLRPAYVLESDGVCGVDAGRGVTQDIDVTLGGARLVERPGSLPSGIREESLLVSDEPVPSPVALPLRFKGRIVLALLTERGEKVRVEAQWAESTLVGTAAFVEEFKGRG